MTSRFLAGYVKRIPDSSLTWPVTRSYFDKDTHYIAKAPKASISVLQLRPWMYLRSRNPSIEEIISFIMEMLEIIQVTNFRKAIKWLNLCPALGAYFQMRAMSPFKIVVQPYRPILCCDSQPEVNYFDEDGPLRKTLRSGIILMKFLYAEAMRNSSAKID